MYEKFSFSVYKNHFCTFSYLKYISGYLDTYRVTSLYTNILGALYQLTVSALLGLKSLNRFLTNWHDKSFGFIVAITSFIELGISSVRESQILSIVQKQISPTNRLMLPLKRKRNTNQISHVFLSIPPFRLINSFLLQITVNSFYVRDDK
jgi:hypothetical protein